MQGNIRASQTITGNILAKDHISALVNKDYGEKLEGISTETTGTTVDHVHHTIAVNVNTKIIATKEFCYEIFQTKNNAQESENNLLKKLEETSIDLNTKINTFENTTTEAFINVNNSIKKQQVIIDNINANKQEKLVAGRNISISENNVIGTIAEPDIQVDETAQKAIFSKTVDENYLIPNNGQETSAVLTTLLIGKTNYLIAAPTSYGATITQLQLDIKNLQEEVSRLKNKN